MSAFRVLALGSNGAGQLGIGHFDDTSIPQPCLIPELDRRTHNGGRKVSFMKMVAGGNHTLLLTSLGEVFAAGAVEDGRCGPLIEGGNDGRFHQIDLASLCGENDSFRITDVAATWEASFYVLNHKQVFACGNGGRGELGIGLDRQRSTTFSLVLDLKNEKSGEIVEIAGSMNHAVVLTSSGEVYGWGSCRKGQLGEKMKDQKVCWEPQQIELPFKPKRLLVGRDLTCFVDDMGTHLVIGDGKYLQTLHFDHHAPLEFISSGWSNIYILDKGHVDGFGRNDRGQLPSKETPPVRLLATGSEHCIASTADDRVIAWGWGEHGNCGTPVDDRKSVADRWNVIPVNLTEHENVINLAAGCATSFVIISVNP